MGGRYSSGGALPGALWLASIAQMENGSDGADSAGKSAGIRSDPVRTNPLSFNAMQPANQRVLGTAPVIRKT